ncbi:MULTISPECIES: hypothetical protein [Thermoactinomyces]|jgi:hypothetical protein|uniref:Uncharacterized protein n=1 Tax=Thermoactinomyces vulgaris TaxID=2026 RepID=A0ABS0QHN1_THEVU|nr:MULTISPECIES: hypothetical protein [Thermoactinomyces]KFZ39731.1 hypothetical protein JS81_12090 [Thermoactinomyces sp. Gus2-1]KYQ87061.1 hypothetical protein AYX07_08070 [Thermoactinomyces sp. AS95]MBA4551552.1 hypothetical protein [Thermoactinomyces vulgaris]MBA4597505.1 hypothetical protein [Thermoactinomyces vulgaris]MBH8582673.1 hypothetical protein [Thermoactinomyces sp. CICC 10735]
MSKNSFTPEELEQIRAILDEAIRENVPQSQQVEAQQTAIDFLNYILTLPGALTGSARVAVANATGILIDFITALVNLLMSILIGNGNGGTTTGASLMQSLAPNLVNVIAKKVPVTEEQKKQIEQQIKQQFSSKQSAADSEKKE